jgi:hypothetical protein
MSRTLGANVGATVINQDIYELSDTQKQRLGTKCVRGDRVFKYAKATAALTNTSQAVYNTYHQDICYAVCPTASPVGSNKVYVTVGAGDGIANDGAIAAHALEGGYIAVGITGTNRNYAIVDNDAAVSGGTVIITIDGELAVATVAATTYVEVMGSPYRVTSGIAGYARGFMGIPMALATVASPYLWLQTWGPCWVAPQDNVGMGASTTTSHEVVFRHDGSLDLAVLHDGITNTYAQHAGFVMTRAQDDTQGAPFIMLQISA